MPPRAAVTIKSSGLSTVRADAALLIAFAALLAILPAVLAALPAEFAAFRPALAVLFTFTAVEPHAANPNTEMLNIRTVKTSFIHSPPVEITFENCPILVHKSKYEHTSAIILQLYTLVHCRDCLSPSTARPPSGCERGNKTKGPPHPSK